MHGKAVEIPINWEFALSATFPHPLSEGKSIVNRTAGLSFALAKWEKKKWIDRERKAKGRV